MERRFEADRDAVIGRLVVFIQRKALIVGLDHLLQCDLFWIRRRLIQNVLHSLNEANFRTFESREFGRLLVVIVFGVVAVVVVVVAAAGWRLVD